MAIQLSTTVRNARLDQIETTVGTSAVLKLKTGSPPANCAAADSGTVIISYTLASDWAAAAAAGAKSFSSLPLVGAAIATGTLGHYRLYAADGTTCHMQGTIATSGGDMTVDNTSVNIAQTVNVTSWSIADGNA